MFVGKNRKGFLFALGAAATSGFSIYLNRFAVGQTDPVLFSFLKNLIVAVFLGLFLVRNIKSAKSAFSGKTALPLAYVAFLSGGLAFLLFFLGLKETSAVSANFFHKSMFVFVLVASVFALRKLSASRAAISAALLAGNFLFWRVANLSFNSGDLMILGATALWAGEALLAEKFLSGIPAKTISFFRFAGGLPVLGAFLLFRRTTDWSIAFNSFGWTLALAGVLLAYSFLYFSAIKHFGAFSTTAVLSLSPLVTFALSSGISFPTVSQGLGAGLVLAGALALFAFESGKPASSA
ncbi:MAG: DMT family transporter [archaeon]